MKYKICICNNSMLAAPLGKAVGGHIRYRPYRSLFFEYLMRILDGCIAMHTIHIHDGVSCHIWAIWSLLLWPSRVMCALCVAWNFAVIMIVASLCFSFSSFTSSHFPSSLHVSFNCQLYFACSLAVSFTTSYGIFDELFGVYVGVVHLYVFVC